MIMIWDKEKIELLTRFYPTKGRAWCVENLSLTEGQVRSKASRLGLKAMGSSEAWLDGQIKAAQSKIGKKRPEQAEVIRRLFREGKLGKPSEARKRAAKISGKKQRGVKRPEIWLNNPHPRGMSGKKHTDECKQLIGEKSKETWSRMSATDKQARNVKIAKTREKNGVYAIPRTGATWKGGWREIGGVNKYYRSRWEANYARYLQWLKERGEIISWSHEPKTFWFDGVKRGTVSYLPDFCVIEKNGTEVYHEVKGWMDKKSLTKIKRMKKYHPNVRLIVIAAKEYKSICSMVSRFIKDWE